MKPVPHGEPYAGKLHVRFDEGAGVPYGGVPLYSTPLGERTIAALLTIAAPYVIMYDNH